MCIRLFVFHFICYEWCFCVHACVRLEWVRRYRGDGIYGVSWISDKASNMIFIWINITLVWIFFTLTWMSFVDDFTKYICASVCVCAPLQTVLTFHIYKSSSGTIVLSPLPNKRSVELLLFTHKIKTNKFNDKTLYNSFSCTQKVRHFRQRKRTKIYDFSKRC